MWIALRNRLTTRDKLLSWGMNVPAGCLLCGAGTETRNHIFFQCPFSSEVWNSFFTQRTLSPPSSLENIVIWVQTASSNPKVRVICNLLLQAVVYILWKEGNSRLHSSMVKPHLVLVKEIHTTLKAKLFSLDRTPVTRSLRTTTNLDEESYIYTWFNFFQ